MKGVGRTYILGRGNEWVRGLKVGVCRESERPHVSSLLGSRVQARGRWEAEMEGDC